MSESEKMKFGGAALIVIGLGLILFGGSRTTGGSYFEFLGFEFGKRETEPMSRAECLFWGIPLIIGGCVLLKSGW
ncbi:MAG: hypothetical protein ABI411_04505 [Tahibacter sp.]